MNRSEQIKAWLKRVWEMLRPPRPTSPVGPPRKQSSQPEQQRYSIQSATGHQVGSSDSLAEAHRTWQQLTNQQGRIIDNQTGEDVTPPPDDTGRYVVMDKDGSQLESFGNAPAAIDSWRRTTHESGSVIDTKTGEDITARMKGFLTQDQMKEAVKILGSPGHGGLRLLGIDQDLVVRLMEQLNHLPVPVFTVSNIAGHNSSQPKKTVEIKRREVTIKKVRKTVEVEAPGPPMPSGRITVPYPTDEQEVARIRRPSDITRVAPSRLALPRQLLNERMVRRQLPMTVYEEEVNGKSTVRKRKVWQEFEEPDVREWTDKVEVSDDPRAQLLEIVVDVSGSMNGVRMNLAVALAALIVTKHLDDGSRYFYRQFADLAGKIHQALTPADKRHFLKFLIEQKEDRVGSGTNILGAVTTAAADVRSVTQGDDQPEVLLVTDGEGYFTATDIYHAIGTDVTLHTVIVGDMSNRSLQQHSSTYFELSSDGYSVQGGTRLLPSSPYEDQF